MTLQKIHSAKARHNRTRWTLASGELVLQKALGYQHDLAESSIHLYVRDVIVGSVQNY